MYNLKIKEKRAKPSSTKEEIGLVNLSSDDEWLPMDGVDLEDDNADFNKDNEGDDEISRVAAKGKSVLAHDVSDEYHDNDDGSNDDDSDGPPPGFKGVRDFNDYAMDADIGRNIDDEMGDDNNTDVGNSVAKITPLATRAGVPMTYTDGLITKDTILPTGVRGPIIGGIVSTTGARNMVAGNTTPAEVASNPVAEATVLTAD
ncbi:hypothetical protein SO802_001947 [Lithocarpus litseifolius]|uniref:Uncharacterized protein n=1 Tax=Lithocarpus litseifolius TaxID=425828 RepID=A0AAW2DZC0_9ROSI